MFTRHQRIRSDCNEDPSVLSYSDVSTRTTADRTGTGGGARGQEFLNPDGAYDTRMQSIGRPLADVSNPIPQQLQPQRLQQPTNPGPPVESQQQRQVQEPFGNLAS